jgi:hypothetical protein
MHSEEQARIGSVTKAQLESLEINGNQNMEIKNFASRLNSR